MYIPGRMRTASSPSRTVMSVAVYVVAIRSSLRPGRRAVRMRAHAPRVVSHSGPLGVCDALEAGERVMPFYHEYGPPRGTFALVRGKIPAPCDSASGARSGRVEVTTR